MPLIALGLNHLTAPVSLREQVAFDADAAGDALHELTREPGGEEAMILSTCTRTELYVSVATGAENIPQTWLSRNHHRSEERRVGKVCGRTWRARWSP